MEELHELITLMLQNGFSIAVAAYLLVRMDKQLDKLTEAVTKFGVLAEKIAQDVERNKQSIEHFHVQ